MYAYKQKPTESACIQPFVAEDMDLDAVDGLSQQVSLPAHFQQPAELQELAGPSISITARDLVKLRADKGLRGHGYTDELADFFLPPLAEGRGLADCGQHAAGVTGGRYRVCSIPVVDEGGLSQLPDFINPTQFPIRHALTYNEFIASAIPPAAQAVAFVRPDTGAFHYARLNPDGSLSQTDANSFGLLDSRDEMELRCSMEITNLPDIEAFALYCDMIYGTNPGLFFFVRFCPPDL